MSDYPTQPAPPPDEMTQPDHRLPTMPPEADPLQHAPAWFRAGVDEIRGMRDELAGAMSQLFGSGGAIAEVINSQRRTAANVDLILEDLRSIKERLGTGDRRFADLEGRVARLEQERLECMQRYEALTQELQAIRRASNG